MGYMDRRLRSDLLLAENIRALLYKRKEDAGALARWCGHSAPWLSKILSGQRQPKVSDLGRIADFFGLTVSELFQPGISRASERRQKQRRSEKDRRTLGDRRQSRPDLHPDLLRSLRERFVSRDGGRRDDDWAH